MSEALVTNYDEIAELKGQLAELRQMLAELHEVNAELHKEIADMEDLLRDAADHIETYDDGMAGWRERASQLLDKEMEEL